MINQINKIKGINSILRIDGSEIMNDWKTQRVHPPKAHGNDRYVGFNENRPTVFHIEPIFRKMEFY